MRKVACLSSEVETELVNEKMFSRVEVDRAKVAATLVRRTGFPSAGMITAMIERGVLNNCPVTVEDVLRSMKISDKVYITYLKGKSVNKPKIFERPANIPRMIDKKQILFIDNMFVNQIAFLVSISMPMHLTE